MKQVDKYGCNLERMLKAELLTLGMMYNAHVLNSVIRIYFIVFGFCSSIGVKLISNLIKM